jgi:hypothetical protein
MSAQPLPERPDLEQLKRQAKERLNEWKAASSDEGRSPRLRDAQLAIARQYGFDSWDTLRAHIEQLAGRARVDQRRRGLDYEDPVQDVIPLEGPLTSDSARQLAERGVSGVKVDPSVPRDTLKHLASVPTLRRLDLSHRTDLVDADLAFLEAMPQLTAVSLAWCQKIGDNGVAYLRGHQELEQVSLHWTAAGDEAVAALVAKRALARVVLGNNLTDTGVARLRDFPALATAGDLDSFLAVSGGRVLTDQALAYIGELKVWLLSTCTRPSLEARTTRRAARRI